VEPANDAVLTEGRRVLIDDPGRIDGVAVVALAVKTTLWPFFISPFRPSRFSPGG
jgi:hypothetical protein